jgi:hypothetical protein
MNSVGRNAFNAAKAIQVMLTPNLARQKKGRRSDKQLVLPFSVVRGTRSYIERVVNQINGCFENGWHDASAVMIRRLLETLIIEVFEHYKIASRIQNSAGDFFYLRDLIDACLREKTWNLTRNCKQAMPRLKDIGDKSAHSRRYNAHRGDIAPLTVDLRLVVQELVYLATLK